MTTTPDPESGGPADDTDSETVALFEPDPDLIGWERKSDPPGEPPGR